MTSLLVVGGHPSRTETELDSALREEIEGGDLLREHHRVPVVVAEDERPHPERRGGLGGHGQGDQRTELVLEVIRDEQRRVAETFDAPCELAPRVPRRRTRQLDPEPERWHRAPSRSPTSTWHEPRARGRTLLRWRLPLLTARGHRTPGGRSRPPNSPTGPTKASSSGSTPSSRDFPPWSSPARPAISLRPSPRQPMAGPSCCRPATARSRSPSSAPTPSATSSRSSSRWRWCSPTAPGCRWSRSAGSPGSSPSREARPPRRSTVGCSSRSAATWSTTTLPEAEARVPDPSRLVTAYQQSVSTLNLLRAFTKGGFADLSQVHAWNQEFVASSAEGQRFEDIAEGIDSRAPVHGCLRHRSRRRGLAPPGRLLDEPRGAHPRVRGGADPARLADRRLVRLLGPHAVGGRADPTARRRAL